MSHAEYVRFSFRTPQANPTPENAGSHVTLPFFFSRGKTKSLSVVSSIEESNCFFDGRHSYRLRFCVHNCLIILMILSFVVDVSGRDALLKTIHWSRYEPLLKTTIDPDLLTLNFFVAHTRVGQTTCKVNAIWNSSGIAVPCDLLTFCCVLFFWTVLFRHWGLLCIWICSLYIIRFCLSGALSPM